MRGRPLAALLAAVGFAVVLVATGCGSQTTSPSTASPSTTSTGAAPTTTAPGRETMPLTVYELRDGLVAPTTVHVQKTQAVAAAALTALGLPAKVSLTGGTAVVERAHVTPAQAAEIVFTLTQFPSVQRVDVDGRHGLTRADEGSFAPLILVDSPAAGADVGQEIHVSGSADVFEATLVVQLLQRGKLVEQKTVTASVGAPQRGVFTTELHAAAAGAATIVAYAPSAANGAHQHEVRIPVAVEP